MKNLDYETAIIYYEKALEIGINHLGENHANIVKIYLNLGEIYKK